VPPPPSAAAPVPRAPAAANVGAPTAPMATPPQKSNKKLLMIIGAAVAAVVLVVIGVVVFAGGDSSKSGGTDETIDTTEITDDTTDITDDTTDVTDDTTDITDDTLPPDITGDDLRAALVTLDEVNAVDANPVWTETNAGNSGDDLCGQNPQIPSINRAGSAFVRQFGADQNDGQFLTNELQLYSTAPDADTEFDHTLSIVQNCTDETQTINGQEVKLTMNAQRAGSDLLSTFAGCEEAANVLIFSNSDDGTFSHETNVWYMRCGNVTMTVGLDEPSASADADITSALIIGAANDSFTKVTALPLQR